MTDLQAAALIAAAYIIGLLAGYAAIKRKYK